MMITYRCPECDEAVDIDYYGGYPAKTYGLPEDNYPAQESTVDPAECDCGYKFEMHLIEKRVIDFVKAEYDPTDD